MNRHLDFGLTHIITNHIQSSMRVVIFSKSEQKRNMGGTGGNGAMKDRCGQFTGRKRK